VLALGIGAAVYTAWILVTGTSSRSIGWAPGAPYAPVGAGDTVHEPHGEFHALRFPHECGELFRGLCFGTGLSAGCGGKPLLCALDCGVDNVINIRAVG